MPATTTQNKPLICNMQINECGCVPTKNIYQKKKVAGQIWPEDCGLSTLPQ
jgi:hypothetical protein